jgi:integrase
MARKARRKRRRFGRLRKLPSGRWQAAYIGPDHKLHRAPHTFGSDIAAESWLAIERRKIDVGTWGAVERSGGVTLGAYAAQWLQHRPLRPRTRAHYESVLKRLILPALGDAKMVAITPAQIRQWHTSLGAEHRTQNAHAYALLHAICTTAVADEVLDANPCRIRGASQTRRRKDIDVLTPAEVDRLAAAMPPQLRASVILAAWCALRFGELTELRRDDLSPDCAVLRVRRAVVYTGGKFVVGEPKTDAGIRDVAVPPHIRPAIDAHLRKHVGPDPDSLLFGDAGRHVGNPQYRAHFVKARAAIGKPNITPHSLRHFGLTLAAQSGATTAELMRRAGHTTPAMALRYQHVAEGRDAEIAERLSRLAQPPQ